MGTKRIKSEAAEAKAAKPQVKRQVTVRAPAAENRTAPPVGIPTIKTMVQPAPTANLKVTRKPVRKTKAPTAESGAVLGTVEPTTDMIALRAYFIGLRRQEAGVQGDSTTDWLEAEQQLRLETGA